MLNIIIIFICILGIITSVDGMPEPAASIVGWISKIGLGISIIICIRNLIKSGSEFKLKNKDPVGRERIMDLRYHENINSLERKKELIKWNAKHPSTLFEGPINENPALRSLRLSLLTSEQLATIPFMRRVLIRNARCHRTRYADSYRCIICGNECYRDRKWCDRCDERYKKDIASGWKPKPNSHIKEGYEWVLWRLQQIVAKDLQMNIISEETAKVEMQEVVEVARRDIAAIERAESERKASIQQYQDQQSELSNIVKRLS